MTDALKPPADLTDHAAISEWAVKVTAHLEAQGQLASAEATTRLIEAAAKDGDQDAIEKAVARASVVLVLVQLQTLEQRYTTLKDESEKLLPEVAEGSEDRQKLEQSIEAYGIVIDLFQTAQEQMEKGGPEAKAAMETTLADAQKKLAALGLS